MIFRIVVSVMMEVYELVRFYA